MKWRSTHFLGLAISDRAILVTEIANGTTPRVTKSASFVLSSTLSLDQPEPLGVAFASFIKAQGFVATHTAVGVPAKWLITQEKDVPPASLDEAISVLRLQAERQASADAGTMIYDFAGELSGRSASRVLLVGILESRLNAIRNFAESAGLRLGAITSTSFAMVSQLPAEPINRPVVVIARGGTEMVWRHGSTPRALRHVSQNVTGEIADVQLANLGIELKRTIALMPTNGDGRVRQALLLDSAGMSVAQVSYLGERLGLPLTRESVSHDEFASATAVASASIGGSRLLVNFLASKLVAKSTSRMTRELRWGILLAVVLMAAIGMLALLISNRRAELADLQQHLTDIAPKVKEAEALVSRVTQVQGYFDLRSPTLEPMREVTLALRDRDPVWLTSFSIRENRTGQLQGKSTDQLAVLALLDRMIKNNKFANVKLLDMREAAGRSREVTFSISFSYIAPQ